MCDIDTCNGLQCTYIMYTYVLCMVVVDCSLSLLPGSHELVDRVAYKLQQHRFPPHKWNVLATCLRMASVVQEIDADERHVRDKLQALVVRWASTAEQGNLWETLIEAVYMCEEKVIAMKLAEEMGVVYPGVCICVCIFSMSVNPVSCKDH